MWDKVNPHQVPSGRIIIIRRSFASCCNLVTWIIGFLSWDVCVCVSQRMLLSIINVSTESAEGQKSNNETMIFLGGQIKEKQLTSTFFSPHFLLKASSEKKKNHKIQLNW